MTKRLEFGKRKKDCDFIDPATMKKCCSYNQCYKKFTEDCFVDEQEGSLKYKRFFHKCHECKKIISSARDKEKTQKSITKGIYSS